MEGDVAQRRADQGLLHILPAQDGQLLLGGLAPGLGEGDLLLGQLVTLPLDQLALVSNDAEQGLADLVATQDGGREVTRSRNSAVVTVG